MALTVTHTKVSGVSDTGDTSLVRPSDWNATHTIAGGVTESFILACSDETSAVLAGTAAVTFRIPYAFTIAAVRASLTTAQTSGSLLTVDIRESGSTILSTLLTIDNGERTSTTATTPVVISDASLASDAEIKIDVTQVGDGTATGLKVVIVGTQT